MKKKLLTTLVIGLTLANLSGGILVFADSDLVAVVGNVQIPYISDISVEPSTYDVYSGSPLYLKWSVSNLPSGGEANLKVEMFDSANVLEGIFSPGGTGITENGEGYKFLLNPSTFFYPNGQHHLNVSAIDGNGSKLGGAATVYLTLERKAPIIDEPVLDTQIYNSILDTNGIGVDFDLINVRQYPGQNPTASIIPIIYNNQNQPIETLPTENVDLGSHHFEWDGKIDGSPAKSGDYTLKLTGSIDYPVIQFDNGGSYTISPQVLSFTVIGNDPAPEEGGDPTPIPANETCAGFTDIDQNDANCDAYEYVKNIGAMTGNPDGTFESEDLVQRDEIAKIVLETFDLFDKQIDYCQNVKPFTDLTSAAWSYQYICRGKGMGMITGYLSGADTGKYRPDRSVNRAEFLALTLRNLEDDMPSNNSSSYSDVPTGQWYSGFAKYSKDHALFTGSKLYLTNFMTRGEVAQVIFKLHDLGKI